MAKSRRILKERDELMASATAQADSIIADAQQQALTIAGEQEIVRLAQQQAMIFAMPSSMSARRAMLPRTMPSRCSLTLRRTSRA